MRTPAAAAPPCTLLSSLDSAQRILPPGWIDGGTADYCARRWLAEGSHEIDGAAQLATLLESSLPLVLRCERLVRYDADRFRLVEAAMDLLLTPTQRAAGATLADLHLLAPLDHTMLPPLLRKARIAAGLAVPTQTKAEAKAARRHWAKRPELAAWRAAYVRFVRGCLAPTVVTAMRENGDSNTAADECVVQRVPVLRVVFPRTGATVGRGGALQSIPHRDADYRHQTEELNCWVPLTDVAKTNSLYVESSPGEGDWHAWTLRAPWTVRGDEDADRRAERDVGDGRTTRLGTGAEHSGCIGGREEEEVGRTASPSPPTPPPPPSHVVGEAVLWWGVACRHFSLPNVETTTRVSLDCRIVPPGLWRGEERGKVVGPDGTLLQLGAYYARLRGWNGH